MKTTISRIRARWVGALGAGGGLRLSTRIRAYMRQNVLGLVAIFIALSGTAYATHPGGQNTISTADIIDGEVKEADVGQGAIASAEVKNDSIVAGDVAPNSLGSNRIADASLTGNDVQKDALTGADVTGLTGADLAPNSIPTGRITDGSLTGADVAQNSLKGVDIDESTLSSIGGGGPAGGDLTGSYPDPEIGSGAVGTSEVADDSLTGDDVNEASLGQVPSALLGGFGRTGAEGSCDPESTTFIGCAATPVLNVPAGARALILARAHAQSEGGDAESGLGECRLGTSSIGVVPNTTVEFKVFEDRNLIDDKALMGITPPLPPGTTLFGIDCNQLPNFGAIEYFQVSATVLLIASN